MTCGLLRYWAAARAATGVAEEEFCADTLAAALEGAVFRHGPALERVIAVASFLVDGEPVGARSHASVLLPERATVEVLPPFAGGSADGLSPGPVGRQAGSVVESDFSLHRRRQRAGGAPLLAPALGAALVSAVTVGAAYLGRPMLAVALLGVQVVLTLAWFAALDAPGSFGGLIVAAGASVAGDALLATEHGSGIGVLTGVIGLAAVATLGHQLLRRRRNRVAESMAATLAAVVLDLGATTLLGLRNTAGEQPAVVVSVLGVGAALLLARAVDLTLRRPTVLRWSTRTWLGLLAGLGGGCGCGLGYAALSGAPAATSGAKLAVVAAALALAADLAIDLGWRALIQQGSERQRAALTPLAAVLPLAVASPALYVAARVIYG